MTIVGFFQEKRRLKNERYSLKNQRQDASNITGGLLTK